MSSESPPSPETPRTQLIIVRGTTDHEDGGASSPVQGGGDDAPSPVEGNGSVTYRVVSSNEDLTSHMNGGQFYVIPSEVIGGGGGGAAAPPTTTSSSSSSSSSPPNNSRIGKTGNPLRDDRRRATHNEVERRRRDMINTWIMKLARLIPNLSNSSGKSNHSKGGILAKACEYLQATKTHIAKFEEIKKANEALLKENEKLVLAVTNFKKENAALKKQVESLGVTPETIKFEL